jgi:hypothetical protein
MRIVVIGKRQADGGSAARTAVASKTVAFKHTLRIGRFVAWRHCSVRVL